MLVQVLYNCPRRRMQVSKPNLPKGVQSGNLTTADADLSVDTTTSGEGWRPPRQKANSAVWRNSEEDASQQIEMQQWSFVLVQHSLSLIVSTKKTIGQAGSDLKLCIGKEGRLGTWVLSDILYLSEWVLASVFSIFAVTVGASALKIFQWHWYGHMY